jgi:carbon monoxide dehydrogenase subunit G
MPRNWHEYAELQQIQPVVQAEVGKHAAALLERKMREFTDRFILEFAAQLEDE